MSEMTTKIYTRSEDLPEGLSEENFFHSPQLFRLGKQTPRLKPYMVVVEDGHGQILSQMLAMVRYRSSWFPPYLYIHCRVLGEGVYHTDSQRETLFSLMLNKLTGKLGRLMLYIEVSNLSQKMFGYKHFRQQGFFPVRWMSIHNSLHSHTPEERITERMQKRIDTAYERGVTTEEVLTEEDFQAFIKLLRHHNWLKPKRYIPHDDFFRTLTRQGRGRLSITRYRGHVIGCSAVVYSNQNAYLWYSAFHLACHQRCPPTRLSAHLLP